MALDVPVVTARVDWANDGFSSGADDNVSSRVLEASLRRDVSGFWGALTLGGGSLTLDNEDGRYLDDGPLAAQLIPGRRCWITCTYAATTYGLFAGHVRAIVPREGGQLGRVVDLVLESVLDRARRRTVRIPANFDTTVEARRGAILDALYITSALRSLAPEPFPIIATAAEGDALAMLAGLDAATGTRSFVDAGTAEATWIQYITRDRHYKLDAAPDAALVYGATSTT